MKHIRASLRSWAPTPMSRFEEHLTRYGPRLLAEFQDIRARLSDSDVKGGQNEEAVREFLRRHSPNNYIAGSAQILDSTDQVSDEVDAAVCNEYQIFREAKDGILIAEGVDFVVQAKALLNSAELRRVYKNAASVKKLTRTFSAGDSAYAEVHIGAQLRERIPYLCFCFTSELAERTLFDKLNEESDRANPGEAPDALFVLDRGITYINHGDGTVLGQKDAQGKVLVRWSMMLTGERTLVEFLRYAYGFVPRFVRFQPPIVRYFTPRSTYKGLSQSYSES